VGGWDRGGCGFREWVPGKWAAAKGGLFFLVGEEEVSQGRDNVGPAGTRVDRCVRRIQDAIVRGNLSLFLFFSILFVFFTFLLDVYFLNTILVLGQFCVI
jgi:hypothetical protein